MDVLIFVALLIIGGLLNFIIKPKAEYVYKVATAYILLMLLTSVSSWLIYFAGIKSEYTLKAFSFVLALGKHIGHLILGYLIIRISFALKKQDVISDSYELKKLIRSTLWAVSILTGNTFLIATVGKAENMAEMAAFFKASGYVIWLLYFIMTAETLGGLGILLHFKLKTGPIAVAGLMLIMAGAVYTHWHNNDPLSDSYGAVSQFITLSMLLLIYYFEKVVNSKALNFASRQY